jgi:hypothetical protein
MNARAGPAAAAVAAVLALAGCGGAAAPAGLTHADHLACRTVYRIQGLVEQFGSTAGAAGAASSALSGSITTMRAERLVTNPAVAPSLARDARTAANSRPLLLMTGSRPVRAAEQ